MSTKPLDCATPVCGSKLDLFSKALRASSSSASAAEEARFRREQPRAGGGRRQPICRWHVAQQARTDDAGIIHTLVISISTSLAISLTLYRYRYRYRYRYIYFYLHLYLDIYINLYLYLSRDARERHIRQGHLARQRLRRRLRQHVQGPIQKKRRRHLC